jgi:uncharacterized protein (DUF1501 family)
VELDDTDTLPLVERVARRAGSVSVSRRRFLQGGAAGAGALAATQYLGQLRAFAAPPVGATDGIVVLLFMGGGNDGLNTLVPHGDGAYYDLRGGLAISAASVIDLGYGFGLHPSLVNVKKHWDKGRVAIVQGVGARPPNLSHFEATDTWMQGWGGAAPVGTGWLGRWADGLRNAATESLYTVSIGGGVPNTITGTKVRGSSLPTDINGAFGIERDDPSDVRMYDALASYGSGPSGLGAWADSYGRSMRDLMTLTQKIQPAYQGTTPDDYLARKMVLAARLVNANLGIRVLHVDLGGFDTHASQARDHATLLARFDGAVAAFFSTLQSTWTSRVVLMSYSEFGRRPEANGDGGTDHGTAGVMFVIGDKVRGGLHGATPSLTDLDPHGNLKIGVDFRSVYASVLAKWLAADDTQVLGKTYSKLDLFKAGPGTPPPSGSTSASTVAKGYWVAGPNGNVRRFGAAPVVRALPRLASPICGGTPTPSGDGMYLCARDGAVFTFGDAVYRGSMGGKRLNKPVVGMARTPTGRGYWLVASDGGIFSFGDARFYGSTGAMRLNKPVVGMAATPTGKGYLLVASDGGIFSFGDARFRGSTGAMRLAAPIVAMAATPTGKGYWLGGADGEVFTFGDAKYYGSGVSAKKLVLGFTRTPSGRGYWLVAADGSILRYGDAKRFGQGGGAACVLVPSW